MGLILILLAISIRAELPAGLMLNLDPAQTENSLIYNKALFPLHVPIGDLRTETIKGRSALIIEPGQGLPIPHSSLLNPNGKEWIVSTRIRAEQNGIVLTQTNPTNGYAIFIHDNALFAAVHTGGQTTILKADPTRGLKTARNRWLSVELRIQPDCVHLNINRRRVAQAPLSTPLSGEDHKIHIASHPKPPEWIKTLAGIPNEGFSGALRSLKMHRQ